MKKIVSVIGSADPAPEIYEFALFLGKALAREGYVVLSGGLTGVMEAVSRGAREEGGITIGIIPTYSKNDANPYIDIPVVTGLGHARNIIVAASGDVVVAVGGGYGTLSEIAIALKLGKKVFGYRAPQVEGVEVVESVEEVLEKIKTITGGG